MWVLFDRETLRLGPFLWLGGRPGDPLPDLRALPVARHTKADASGKKRKRPGLRVVPRSRFERLESLSEVIAALFDSPSPETPARTTSASVRSAGGPASRIKRVFAVDWSGDKKYGHRKTWVCEVADGRVVHLENGRTREEIVAYLIEEAGRDARFVVGLDFAFSLTAAFLRTRGHEKVEDLWAEVEARGEEWLARCDPPFWGKPGKKRPAPESALNRRAELAVARDTGLKPLSVFQIGGAGAVGVGSLRGLPALRRLAIAGFSIWPFHLPRLPLVVEIWPRLFIGRIRKSSREERTRYLRHNWPDVKGDHRRAAERSDDAFDALVSALAMDRHRDDLASLKQAADGIGRLEGEIWRPGN